MKKYFWGLLALLLAVGFSAFTIPAKRSFSGYYFRYDQYQGFTQVAVQMRSNWRLILPHDLPRCSFSDVKACEFGVEASDVDFSFNPAILKSTVVIPVSEKVPFSNIYRVEFAGPVTDVMNGGN